MKRKKGSIEIIFLVSVLTFCIITFFVAYVLYTQISTYIIPIKQDLFYIVQNSYFSLNEGDLEYNSYVVNEKELREKISFILEKNYSNAKLLFCNYDYYKNNVNVAILVNIEPVALKKYIGNITIKIEDKIKLKMMEVK